MYKTLATFMALVALLVSVNVFSVNAQPTPITLPETITLTKASGRVLEFDRIVGTDCYAYGSQTINVYGNSCVPPTTTPPTTTPPTTTPPTTTPPTTTPPVTGSSFSETFDGNTGLDRFRTGVYHRDNVIVTQTSWQGDHNLNCDTPATSRTIHRSNPDESFYTCKDHLMTSVGDTSGYSVAWFSPNQTFNDINEVCWDVNLTWLGNRQWWKVAVLSVNAPDIMSEVGASDLSGLEGSDRAIASWGGVGGAPGKLRIGNERMDWYDFLAGNDKATRYPACFKDNKDGTLSFTMTGPKQLGGQVETETFTVNGSFPVGEKKVVFQDHNYTPTKSDNGVNGNPIGFTWHWDNITVS